jgi:hypothetical protein
VFHVILVIQFSSWTDPSLAPARDGGLPGLRIHQDRWQHSLE